MKQPCSICTIRAAHGDLSRADIKKALEGCKELQLCDEDAGEIIAIVLGEIPPKDPPERKVRATEIDDGMGWQDEHDPLSGNPIGEQEEIAGRIT